MKFIVVVTPPSIYQCAIINIFLDLFHRECLYLMRCWNLLLWSNILDLLLLSMISLFSISLSLLVLTYFFNCHKCLCYMLGKGVFASFSVFSVLLTGLCCCCQCFCVCNFCCCLYFIYCSWYWMVYFFFYMLELFVFTTFLCLLWCFLVNFFPIDDFVSIPDVTGFSEFSLTLMLMLIGSCFADIIFTQYFAAFMCFLWYSQVDVAVVHDFMSVTSVAVLSFFSLSITIGLSWFGWKSLL